MTLRRGFRAEAERIAAGLRDDLGIHRADPLPLDDAAEARSVRLVSAADLIDPDRLAELERIQAFSFSACTFHIDGHSVIVYNPIRSEPRRKSDVAHELSHLLLEHELTEIREVAGVPFRTCRADQEEEATNLAGTLLLPRPLLLRAVAQGLGPEGVATAYGVTLEMARFRINTTGVATQMQRARARRAR
ncbi:MAG: ImmA/IrrE family metallo-endopeptidase [Gemmatimonadota bacterium]|nr:ImmA/IrrE family metallo-endopeptidase [Gemmatimonadota bacterium]